MYIYIFLLSNSTLLSTIALHIYSSLSPSKGGYPHSIIYSITPIEKTSHFSSYFLFCITSGDIYKIVPAYPSIFCVLQNFLELPKSIILINLFFNLINIFFVIYIHF
jgi:hypothetical protein